MLKFLLGVKFARPICKTQIFLSRPMVAVRFFTQTGFKSKEEFAHLERRTRPKSGIPKKGPTWWESSKKQMGEEWEKAVAGVVFLGFSLLFVKGVRGLLNVDGYIEAASLFALMTHIVKIHINIGFVRV